MSIIIDIKDCHAHINDQPILKGLNLQIRPGEVHAIMGPNGSGKSTLASVLARKPGVEVTKGSIEYLGENLLDFSAEQAACKGIFLGFQYPVEIPGVSNIQFLKSALNAVRKAHGKPLLDAADLLAQVKEKSSELGMPADLLSRSLNDGFSGGEKKRNEILQMSLLEPTLAILDETDSGLDIDALKAVAAGINAMRSPNRSILLITHYQRLLSYIEPDFVHVLQEGVITQSGDKTLSYQLEQEGYGS